MEAIWIGVGIVVGIILLAIIFSSASSENRKDYRPSKEPRPSFDQKEQIAFGKRGEDEVYEMISGLANEYGGYSYKNVAFKDERGHSTEIDAILICRGGFFVIEVKSNKGIIHRNDNDDSWYAEKEEWQDDKDIRNPIKQNQGHINHLRRTAGNGFPYLTSLVIFPCANIDLVRSETIHDLKSASSFIKERIAENKYKKETVDRFNEQFKTFMVRFGISNEEHVKNIRNKHQA